MLAVRPECVRLTHVPPTPNGCRLNTLEGKLIESIYEGGRRRWAVRVAGGRRVVVREANGTHGTLPADDATVYVSWEATRSLVYPLEANGQH